ncbi:hypothetical protein BaRGS_00024027 [Batillaria attramentaria]|uniref:Uncharacterized protein n=1 Tax=Batillaria attramentaria TaxID=370345 RepID=A0ABD0KCH3_9CAEN
MSCAGAAKRNHSTDTSQEQSSPEIVSERKAELLQRARKIRKNQHENDADRLMSIKTHFSVVNKKTPTTGVESAMASGGETASHDGKSATNPSLTDIMRKLCSMEKQLTVIQDLQGEVFELRQENDKLRKDLDKYKEIEAAAAGRCSERGTVSSGGGGQKSK